MDMKIHLAICLAIFLSATAATVLAGEQEERDNITRNVVTAIMKRNLGEVENIYESLSVPTQKTGSGQLKLITFTRTISDPPFGNPNNPELPYSQYEATTRQWTVENPTSSLAIAMHARAILSHAFFIRGTSYANEVPPQAWIPFHAKARESYEFLLKNKEIGSKSAEWYVTLLSAGLAIQLDRPTQLSIASEGLIKFTEDDRIPRTLIEYLLPKWYGSADDIDDYIVSITSGKPQGAEWYTRLYIDVAFKQYGEQFFANSMVNWGRMKHGFKEIINKYPTEWNKNMFAYYSCLARDKETTQNLLAAIGDQPVLNRWGMDANKTFGECRRWADAP